MTKLTPFELEVMNVLWRTGEASVRQICDSLNDRKRPAYTTVQTIVLRLEAKNAVRRTRKIGNAFMFTAVISRVSIYRRLVDDFLRLFGGAQPVVAHMLESGKLTLRDLKALEQAQKKKRTKEGK